MPSLDPHPTGTPAEDLQTSRVRSNRALRAKRSELTWKLGSWNVRSMLNAEGTVETARQGAEVKNSLKEERKVDLVIRELDRYGVTIGAMQETKWFGVAEYKVGECCACSWKACTNPRGTCSERRGSSHSAIWTSHSCMEVRWKTVKGLEL